MLRRDGPIFYALARHFGLLESIDGNEKLKGLHTETVMKVLVGWHQYKTSLYRMANGKEYMAILDGRTH